MSSEFTVVTNHSPKAAKGVKLKVILALCVLLLLICVASIVFWLRAKQDSTFDDQLAELAPAILTSNFTAQIEPSKITSELVTTLQGIFIITTPTTPWRLSSDSATIESEITELSHTNAVSEHTDEAAITVSPNLAPVLALSTSPPDPIEEVTSRSHSQHVPQCNYPENSEPSECFRSHFDSKTKEERVSKLAQTNSNGIPTQLLSHWIQPIEYSLNLSVGDANEYSLDGTMDVLLEVLRDSNIVVLHAAKFIRFIDPAQFSIWSCTSHSFICVHSVTRILERELLIVELAASLAAGSWVRLRVGRFESELSQRNDGLVVQIPSKWERGRPWVVSSQFHGKGARAVFPSVDEPEAKAILRLCLKHPSGLTARSNTAKSTESVEGEMIRTCFRETTILAPEHFAFLLFNNMKSVLDPAAVPTIEVFIGHHLNQRDYQWVANETRKALDRMRELTRVIYPLEKLTVVSTPLTTTDATHNFGLVQIKESWVEYPKFVFTHQLLASQIVQQWTANVISICDKCFQHGLSAYLEWLISAEIAFPGDAQEQRAEVRRRFDEVRGRLLSSGGGDQTSRVFAVSPLKAVKNGECADREAVNLFTLDDAFGRQAMVDYLVLLFQRFAWQRCVSARELSALFREATQSSEAQKVFDSFVATSASKSTPPLSPPLVRVHLHHNGSLVLSQQPSATVHAIPLELVDDTNKRMRVILNDTQLALSRVVSYVLAEPIAYARFIYNEENYKKLSDCMGHEEERCPSVKRQSLQNAVGDLCWALFEGQLNSGEDTRMSAGKWREVFDRLSARNAVHGDCACCMQQRHSLRAQCRWVWADKCSQIALLNDA